MRLGEYAFGIRHDLSELKGPNISEIQILRSTGYAEKSCIRSIAFSITVLG